MYHVRTCMNICLVKLFLSLSELSNHSIAGESGLSAFFSKTLLPKFEPYFDLNFVTIFKKTRLIFLFKS